MYISVYLVLSLANVNEYRISKHRLSVCCDDFLLDKL